MRTLRTSGCLIICIGGKEHYRGYVPYDGQPSVLGLRISKFIDCGLFLVDFVCLANDLSNERDKTYEPEFVYTLDLTGKTVTVFHKALRIGNTMNYSQFMAWIPGTSD